MILTKRVRHHKDRNRLKLNIREEKGSISIHMVIILPVLIIGMLSILLILRQQSFDNKIMNMTVRSSETQLSKKSNLFDEDYKMLVYKDDAFLGDLLDDMTEENQLEGLYTYEITKDNLDDPNTFYATFVMASRSAVSIKVANHLLDRLMATEAYREKADKMKENLDKLEELGEKMKLDDLNKGLKNFTSRVSSSERTKKFIALKNSVEEQTKDFNIALEKIEGHEEAIKDAKAQFESKTGDLSTKIEAASQLSDELGAIEADLKTLKTKVTILNQSYRDALAEDKASIKEEIDDLNDQIDDMKEDKKTKSQALDDKLDTLRGDTKSEKGSLVKAMEKLADLVYSSTSAGDLAKVETNELYSHTAKNFEIDTQTYTQSYTYLLQWIIDNEYMLTIFPNRLEKKDQSRSPFKGDIEYIITGHGNEATSYLQIDASIFAFREVINLGAVLMDGEAQTTISEMCALVPYPFGIIAYALVNVGWSAGESYIEVKEILRGGEVPLLKTTKDFTLSLEGIETLSVSDIEKMETKALEEEIEAENDDVFKMDYKDHIRFFLYLQKHETTILRAMDIMELSLKEADETLANYSNGHEIKVKRGDKIIIRMDQHYE